MNKVKRGRPVDISGINIDEIEKWMKSNTSTRKILICQSILALNKNVAMTEVCNVLGVTRESVRLWKEQLRTEGLAGLLRQKKVGKRSKLNRAKKKELKSIVGKSPKKQGYDKKRWTGMIVRDFVFRKWGIAISLRTAQLWLSKIH